MHTLPYVNECLKIYANEQYGNSEIKEFINYVKSNPLQYALCDFLDPFYPKQVCDFYYSCSVDSNARTITRSIGDGQYRVTIDVESFQTTLCVPSFKDYSEAPSEESCKSVHEKLGYNFKLEGLTCDTYKNTLH
ncbi:unnamed protein product [Lactuca saligna]|uniref:Uncharacterized protein n=1 Tax=Lactuca saligna TaxID=75948 RepID=A0AA35V271_LACSI|nr:unnamed protein product [Lactuca saligna]